MLSGLIPGPKASEARAQLAMLAIQDGELESAERWVGQEPPYYPGVVYAQALLESRRGNIEQARHLLESFEELFGSTDSPYVMGSRRLLAAIADRQGNSERAESLYRDVLNAHPDDPITSARLARLLVRGEYEQARRGLQPEDESIDILLRDALKCGDWVSDYRGLHRVMTDKEPDEAWLDSGWSSAWLQAITWQLLRAGRASDAYQTIIAAAGDAPRWQQRAKLILTAWHLLTTLWEQYSFATRSSEAVAQPAEGQPEEQSSALQDRLRQIASCAREIETLCPADSDELLCNWLVLLCRAVELCRGEAGPLGPSELWMKTKPGPLALLATVSGDGERNGANAVRVLLSSGEIDAYWNKDQLNLARAIDAYNGAKDEAFLDTFIQLQHRLEELPVDAAGFWLPAADIWLRRKNWKALLEDEMPDSIADLSDARVRLVIGLGYAQSSLDEISNGDLRLAQKRVRQARATLGPLIEQGEEDAVR
jgi:tetratricopeptide (TPR) repeat protein